MTCTEKLDYTEAKVRRFNFTLFLSCLCQDTRHRSRRLESDSVQWMTITSFVPCYAPHVPQHVSVSLFVPLNQIMISAPSAETDFAYLD